MRGENSNMNTETWKSRLQVERRDQVSGLKQELNPKASKIDMITETWKSYCNGGLQDEQGDQVAHLKK